jgi:cystathionine beta-synthase
LPGLVHVHPDETVRQAIEILREFGVSQMPVVSHEPPLVAAEVRGAVHERDLLEAGFANPAVLDGPLGDVMGAPLPMLGGGESVEDAVAALEANSALLVLDGGHPVGILTRSDLLDFLVRRTPS